MEYVFKRFPEAGAPCRFWILELQAQFIGRSAFEDHAPVAARHTPSLARRWKTRNAQRFSGMARDAPGTRDAFSRGPTMDVHRMPASLIALARPISRGMTVRAARV